MHKYSEYFMEVVRQGSVVRAAQNLYLSQPSLSKYIHKLEQSLQTQLFDRSVSPMRLNEAGRIYYEYLQQQSRQERLMLEQIRYADSGLRGTLRIGMPLFFSQCYFPEAMEQFQKRYPMVTVSPMEASGEALEQAVLNGQIDFAVLHLPLTHPQLDSEPMFTDKIYLVVPSEGGGEINGEPEQMENLNFILPLEEQKLGRYTAEYFVKRKIVPKVRLRTRNMNTMLEMVRRGFGACFVTEGAIAILTEEDLSHTKLYTSDEMYMQVVAVTNRDEQLPEYGRYFKALFKELNK